MCETISGAMVSCVLIGGASWLRCECKQRDYNALEGLRCAIFVQAYRCIVGNIGNSMRGVCLKYAWGLWQVCLTNFTLFVNHFFYESGPTSYKMYCVCMLYSWYGSVPVEYDAQSSIT